MTFVDGASIAETTQRRRVVLVQLPLEHRP